MIREEYNNGSKEVLKKIDWLQENGWDQVWRARGDGDCFYRCEQVIKSSTESADIEVMLMFSKAFTIAYFLRILHSSDPPLEANLAFEAIQRTLPVMQQVGFQEDLVSLHPAFLAGDKADR